jgi:thioredoxin-like negative regulator of GroEL
MSEDWYPSTVPLRAIDLRHFAPILDSVRQEFADSVAFRSVDVDDKEMADFCRECEVVNVPALGCFVDGRRVRTIIGLIPAKVLREHFATLLESVRHG